MVTVLLSGIDFHFKTIICLSSCCRLHQMTSLTLIWSRVDTCVSFGAVPAELYATDDHFRATFAEKHLYACN